MGETQLVYMNVHEEHSSSVAKLEPETHLCAQQLDGTVSKKTTKGCQA